MFTYAAIVAHSPMSMSEFWSVGALHIKFKIICSIKATTDIYERQIEATVKNNRLTQTGA